MNKNILLLCLIISVAFCEEMRTFRIQSVMKEPNVVTQTSILEVKRTNETTKVTFPEITDNITKGFLE